MKFKKLIPLLIILIGLGILTKKVLNNRELYISKEPMKIYINAADEVSKNNLQINWKYLAAIDAVRLNRNFSKTNINNAKDLANIFLKKSNLNNKKYELLSLDEVLSKLSFTDNEKNTVYKYLKDLKDVYPIQVSENKKSFIKNLTPKAEEIYEKYGILPSITITQAALESDWGKSDLTTKANNLFGIKATKNWKGKTISMKTSENYNDTIVATFRAYDSKEESLNDYAKFLKENSRYAQSGVFKGTHYKEQAEALQNAGYSTKKDALGNNIYASILIQLIQEYNLQLIDSNIQQKLK